VILEETPGKGAATRGSGSTCRNRRDTPTRRVRGMAKLLVSKYCEGPHARARNDCRKYLLNC
jgi:hypothetical protein